MAHLKTSDFDYDLPGELIAQKPVQRRDHSRLMVLDRATGRIGHHVFCELPALLKKDDLMVLNDTRVVPARFFCRRLTGPQGSAGGLVEGLFLRELSPRLWEVMLKRAGRCRVGEELSIREDPSLTVRLEERLGEGLWRLSVASSESAHRLLGRIGTTPLPPYIHRGCPDNRDQVTYQTVYASRPGASAAPTAGLHFSEGILADLRDVGVELANVTLHVGLGTFSPVKSGDLAGHKMHSEWYELPAGTAETVTRARGQGRRVVAVGTTSLRVLETSAVDGVMSGREGWTDLFVYPPASFKAVDVMITNFHLPRSTLLMLVAAFCSPGSTDGIGMIRDAYAEAVSERYRFYSYGDAMLIL